jgi:hypothetical protein
MLLILSLHMASFTPRHGLTPASRCAGGGRAASIGKAGSGAGVRADRGTPSSDDRRDNSPSREGQGRRSRVEYYFLRLRQSATRTLGQRACVSRLPSFGSKLACVRARPSFHGPDAALVRAPRLTACTCIYLGAGVCSLFRPSELQALQHSTRSISSQPGFRSGRQEPHFGH